MGEELSPENRALVKSIAPRCSPWDLTGNELQAIITAAEERVLSDVREHLKRAEWQVDRLAGDYRGVNWDAVCGLMLGEVRQALARIRPDGQAATPSGDGG